MTSTSSTACVECTRGFTVMMPGITIAATAGHTALAPAGVSV